MVTKTHRCDIAAATGNSSERGPQRQMLDFCWWGRSTDGVPDPIDLKSASSYMQGFLD